jgi:hypothetical protein
MCAAAGRTSPPSPYGGQQQAIKAKEPEVRRQVALTISPVEATTSAVGSLTSGDDHLNTDDSGHLCTSTVPANGGRARRSLRSRPHYRSEDKTIQECRPHPHGVRRLVRPPSTTGAAREAVDVANPRTARPSPVRWMGSHALPQAGEPDTLQLTAPQTANALLPRSLREEAGRYPRGGGSQLSAPSSPARMMNILEAEVRRKAAARFASPHHKAGSHRSG